MEMMFKIPEGKLDLFAEWVNKQDKVTAEKQGEKFPYYGSIGGELTYEFTPTGLGIVCKVRHNLTNEVFDLTEYGDW